MQSGSFVNNFVHGLWVVKTFSDLFGFRDDQLVLRSWICPQYSINRFQKTKLREKLMIRCCVEQELFLLVSELVTCLRATACRTDREHWTWHLVDGWTKNGHALVADND